jgi:hypothetical protein
LGPGADFARDLPERRGLRDFRQPRVHHRPRGRDRPGNYSDLDARAPGCAGAAAAWRIDRPLAGPKYFPSLRATISAPYGRHRQVRDLTGETGVSLINLVIILVVVGVLLWLVNTYIPMDGKIKSILNAVVVIAVVLWLLQAFGLLDSLKSIHIGR